MLNCWSDFNDNDSKPVVLHNFPAGLIVQVGSEVSEHLLQQLPAFRGDVLLCPANLHEGGSKSSHAIREMSSPQLKHLIKQTRWYLDPEYKIVSKMSYMPCPYPSSYAFNDVQNMCKSKNTYGVYALVVLILWSRSMKTVLRVPSSRASSFTSVISLVYMVLEQAQTF